MCWEGIRMGEHSGCSETETALCTWAEFQPGNSASLFLLLYLVFYGTCLYWKYLPISCCIFFLPAESLHSSPVLCDLCFLESWLGCHVPFCFPPSSSVPALHPNTCAVLLPWHPSGIRVSQAYSRGRIYPVLRACYSCDVHVLKLFIFLAQR